MARKARPDDAKNRPALGRQPREARFPAGPALP